MVTQEMKNQGIKCKGQGFNCPNCPDKNDCVDYVEVNVSLNLTKQDLERIAHWFYCLQNFNPAYIEKEDQELINKIDKELEG